MYFKRSIVDKKLMKVIKYEREVRFISYGVRTDFIDYDNRTRANLRLILNAELVKKFTGTDFYYLSTNSSGQVLSGVLFEAQSPFANLLPTIVINLFVYFLEIN